MAADMLTNIMTDDERADLAAALKIVLEAGYGEVTLTVKNGHLFTVSPAPVFLAHGCEERARNGMKRITALFE